MEWIVERQKQRNGRMGDEMDLIAAVMDEGHCAWGRDKG